MKFVEKNAEIKFKLPEHPHLQKSEEKKQKEKTKKKNEYDNVV
jgi:hypothetical protein